MTTPHFGSFRLVARDGLGRVLDFDDDSRWEVQPGYEILSSHWEKDVEIVVVPGGTPGYPVDLLNQATGDRIPARHKASPARWRIRDEGKAPPQSRVDS